jgi:hypothetical protein
MLAKHIPRAERMSDIHDTQWMNDIVAGCPRGRATSHFFARFRVLFRYTTGGYCNVKGYYTSNINL